MKRLITGAMALILAAGIVHAVESDNQVGYQTLDITGGKLNMLAVQWDLVGGGDLDIQDIIGDTSVLTGSTFADIPAADVIKVWDPSTSNYTDFWLYDSGGAYPTWDGKWIDNTGYIASETFPKGSTFWLESRGSDTSVVSAGQVPVAATVSTPITAGKLNMIANPYPTAYEMNGAFVPDLLTAGAQGSTFADIPAADTLKVWDPVTSNYTDFWLYDSGGAYPTWDGKWIDNTGYIATDSLAMGQPAWYQSNGSTGFNFVFSKPY